MHRSSPLFNCFYCWSFLGIFRKVAWPMSWHIPMWINKCFGLCCLKAVQSAECCNKSKQTKQNAGTCLLFFSLKLVLKTGLFFIWTLKPWFPNTDIYVYKCMYMDTYVCVCACVSQYISGVWTSCCCLCVRRIDCMGIQLFFLIVQHWKDVR